MKNLFFAEARQAVRSRRVRIRGLFEHQPIGNQVIDYEEEWRFQMFCWASWNVLGWHSTLLAFSGHRRTLHTSIHCERADDSDNTADCETLPPCHPAMEQQDKGCQ